MITTTKYVAMTRPRRVLNISLALEAVTHAPDGLDEARALGVVGELLPQVPYVDVDRAGVTDVLVSPHLLHQPVAGEHDSRVGREDVKEVELLRGQLHLPDAVDLHPPAPAVHGEAPALEEFLRFLGGRLRPPEHRLDARDQLARAERLCEVIVGAQLQAHYLVHLGLTRCEHDDRDLRSLADLPEHFQAVLAGEHDVQHQKVGFLGEELLDRGVAVEGRGDAIAFLFEVQLDELDDVLLVVNNQNLLLPGFHPVLPLATRLSRRAHSTAREQGPVQMILLTGGRCRRASAGSKPEPEIETLVYGLDRLAGSDAVADLVELDLVHDALIHQELLELVVGPRAHREDDGVSLENGLLSAHFRRDTLLGDPSHAA